MYQLRVNYTRLCVVFIYAVMLSVCLLVYFLIIALFIFLLGSLAQLLQTKQIFPKHSGQEVADSIDLRIWSTDNQCSTLYPRLSDGGQLGTVHQYSGCQISGPYPPRQ